MAIVVLLLIEVVLIHVWSGHIRVERGCRLSIIH